MYMYIKGMFIINNIPYDPLTHKDVEIIGASLGIAKISIRANVRSLRYNPNKKGEAYEYTISRRN